MSFFRTLLAATAALMIASPVLADETPASATAPATMSTSATTTTSSSTTQTQININTASAKDLMKVKGISASKARAIVSYRKKHGNFTSTDDLAKVKGFTKMKPNTLQAIQGQLTTG